MIPSTRDYASVKDDLLQDPAVRSAYEEARVDAHGQYQLLPALTGDEYER